MELAHQRAVVVLGAVQCVFWGLLYYGFSALLVPLQQGLGLGRPTVAGAFSLGLLAAALAAPGVGRALDRGAAAQVFRRGSMAAVAGLVLLACAGGVLQLYLAWFALGLAMAALLYEPAFALVARSFHTPGDRLRALSTVTVMGGLASTLWLPLFSLAIERAGWRGATLLAAVVLAAAALALERRVLPVLLPLAHATDERRVDVDEAAAGPGFAALRALSVVGTLAGVGLGVLLIPLLLERGASPVLAAAVLGMFGLSQLPGRVWLMRSRELPAPGHLIVLPLLLQAAGLATIVAFQPLSAAVAGVALFGLGAGVQAITRPWLVQQLFGTARAGALNGRLARSQGLARAGAPLSAALLAGHWSTALALGALAGVLLLALPVALPLARLALTQAAPAATAKDVAG